MSQNTSTDAPDLQVLLVEYEKAQDSAEHHDSLLWTSVSIIFGGMLALLGFVLSSLGSKEFNEDLKWVFIAVSALSIVLTIAAIRIVGQINKIKRLKYNRCKAIEEQIGAKQHRCVDHPAGSQTRALIVISIMFLLVWFIIIGHIWLL